MLRRVLGAFGGNRRISIAFLIYDIVELFRGRPLSLFLRLVRVAIVRVLR